MTVLSRLFNKAPLPTDSADAIAEANDQPMKIAEPASGRAIDVEQIDVETLLPPSALSVDPASLQQAIAAIADPATLSKLAIEGASTAVRQLAAQAIHDPTQLRDLLKHAGDKIRLYRLAVAQNTDEQESAKQAALAFVDGVSYWPKGVLQTLKSELAKIGAADIPQTKTNYERCAFARKFSLQQPHPRPIKHSVAAINRSA